MHASLKAGIEHIVHFYIDALSFKRPTTIERFWIAIAFYVVATAVFYTILKEIYPRTAVLPFHSFSTWVYETWLWLHIIPIFTLIFRRLHDGGQPWWRIFTLFIPYIGFFVFMYFLNQPTAIRIRQI
jgi:uncharacterized membrane protein YhaH (DUF805 family)